MKKIIFSLLLLSFVFGGTVSCGPKSSKTCKKNIKKIKKMRKQGKIGV